MQRTTRYSLSTSERIRSSRSWADFLSRRNDPAILARDQKTQAFLQRAVFDGLIDVKPIFDSPAIKHFEFADFGVVVERCTLHNVRVIGIEVFRPQAELVDVEIASEKSCTNAWCLEFVKRFEDRPGFTYCATYDVTSNA